MLTWANPTLDSLEEQALTPMLGEQPVELGLKGHEAQFLDVLRRDPVYQRLVPQAFPEIGDTYTLQNVSKAIAAFERTIISMRSPYDRYRWAATLRRSRIQPSVGSFCFRPVNMADVFSAMAGGI